MKIDILAIGVHPDDVELSACGTLLRHISQGKTVGLLDLTRGELGSRGSAELRDLEAAESARKMGATFRRNLGMADGFFQYSQENLLRIIEIIRWCQPEIVLANSIDDRHPDHGRAAKLVADACFYSGLLKIETSFEGQPQQQWRPKAVYHYIQDKDLTPDFVVDISPFMEKKLELILTFRSQFYQTGESEFDKEPKTPISGKDFFEFVKSKNRAFGRPLGVGFAEGFIAHRTPGVNDLFSLK
ncbi:MAG: bacillithiol biosynthesis deacetylase BshB1 [Saprospiraceae bacterium]|nr:bacillithiol biosynthesis deacetylase BshB1 [Saprospiraceae bacterium]MCF8249716.1 bacillithiol biosynthesis deacetylase BshB1 [Saprospiraceae bacterium]MCF8282502.1 bacillithiol biosynthesis deacetylase BshB1 [Bacteroidales bacterium]MCF8314087.1 bacillithiol biosynthesis deacetylase BshB1 [Saprospiraceae bacterium]MCF8442832.1 bacillithiol biosynthesis deacetylase BshB1 [Saprospiraceae bacterium]